MQNSLSAYSSSRKRKRSILKYAYLRSSLESLIYLCTFSLLTVTHLDTWLASSCTRVTIWRHFLLFRLLAKLLRHETTQRIAALERDLVCAASTGAFIHTFPLVSPAAFMIYFTCFIVHVRVSCSPTSTSGLLGNDYLTTSSSALKAWNKIP